MTREMPKHATNIKQTYGPRIQFRGWVLAQVVFDQSTDAVEHTMRIWETAGGAMIAHQERFYLDTEKTVTTALVVDRQDDEQAMQFAVLDFFNWHPRARTMAKELNWNMTRKVE